MFSIKLFFANKLAFESALNVKTSVSKPSGKEGGLFIGDKIKFFFNKNV